MHRIAIGFLMMVFAVSLQAQPLRSGTPEQYLETALEQYEKQDYYNARKYFEKAYDEVKDPRLAQRIGDLNYMLKDYRRAASWYKRILRRDKTDQFVETRFDYAQVLKTQGKYDEAWEQYNYYLEKGNDDEKKAKINNEILGMQLASGMEEDVSIAVENAGRIINGKFLEASPFVDQDGSLYFSTIRSDEVIVLDSKAEDYHAQIYSAQPNKDNNRKPWKKPTALGEDINREGWHVSNVSLSRDGSRMYFTRAKLNGNVVDTSEAFVSFRKAKGWGAAQRLEGVNGENSEYIVRHPAPGELYGNEVLFFSSNMEGGEGGYDLYYCTREGDAKYSLPTNLGPAINTPGDEITPFYQNGVLHFSTNGHPSIGGYDIYSATWTGSEWTEVNNMGLSFNTTYDEFDLSYNNDGSVGYLVSNRPGTTVRSVGGKTCCDDIWEVKKREIVIDIIATVFDEEGKELTDVTAELVNLGDKKAAPNKKKSGDNNEIQYALDTESAYKIVIKKDGYVSDEKEINTVGKMEDYTYNRKFILKSKPKVAEDEEVYTINEPIRLSNIYYDFDDDKILPSAEPDLQRLLDLLNQYPDMVIELSSHTDSQGNDQYNQRLSERRARSAKSWLVQRGIATDRIKPVGYGEEQILNDCVNGVSCEDDEHRFNRRTEFKIIAGPTTITVKKQKK